ncbi:FAD-dependent monooxygenase [Streptomyces sp. NPDC047515]|uniref:FAD-dependent monooxygenase n=1 Tax=Streptomyces sp. NPDC047515 TaxID=3155380 RepID=UPI0033C8B5D5
MSGNGAFKAVVIGGSVGGLAAAHELLAIDADVAVYERSAGTTQARGAGIVMQPEVEALLARLGVTSASVSVELHERQQLHVHGGTTSYKAPQLMTAWDTLYRALREPLAPVCYRLDSSLRSVRVDGSEITAAFADGYTAQGNFLVGADGIGSVTRRLLDVTSRPAYAGYVAWRGLEPESALPNHLLDLLSDRFTFLGRTECRCCATWFPDPTGSERKARGVSTGSGTSTSASRTCRTS